MDLKRLKYFCTVIEHGNITRAAKALHISQPPLSKRLQELEEELGIPLFLRNAGKIEPTPSGFLLYKRASKIFQEIEDVQREAILLAKNETKTLHIGLTHLFQSYFKALILEIHKRHPDIKISVSVSDSSHLELLLNNGLIDVAFIQRPDQMKSYDCLSFNPINLVAVVNNKLMNNSKQETMVLSELTRFPLVLLRKASGKGIFELLVDQLSVYDQQPNIIMKISQPTVILEWLESGLEAASLLPESELQAMPLKNCQVIKILPVPQVFFPSIVKLTTTAPIYELMEVLEQGYPFS
ncbi:LysR family transcriptional regulator [Neisseria sp. Ec49-e6-T10]|uniref:LysR family transcriptional regulator n=1 Tax=Neisseria sp. Ec49-e6-T10 TaxID=3140744 RepID=UPI003EB8965D